MATSPNFNWPEPDNTDLVKNGALAIRTAVNAIDTSLVDLKGGTTGQILAKTSNTDMDFTWVANDVGDITAVTAGTGISGGGTSGAVTITNSMATEIAAKGDLIVGTGSATFDNLAAGNNGETLVADSSTSTGLRYTAGNAVGNPILNSAMQVWQRGTSAVTATDSSTGFAADRWQLWRAAFATGATVSRQVTNDTTNLPFIQYTSRVQRDSGNTGTGTIFYTNTFETLNAIPFAGRTVTLSYYARLGANFSGGTAITASVVTGTGTDQNLLSGFTGQATPIDVSSGTLTTTWQRVSVTGTLASTATQLAVRFSYNPTGTSGANDYYEVTGVQLDIGSVALPFRTYAGAIQEELTACQRYYFRLYPAAINKGLALSNVSTTTVFSALVPFPVEMRTEPTALEQSGTASDYALTAAGSTFTCSAVPTFGAATTKYSGVVNNTVSSGLTAGWAGRYFTNAAGAYLGWSAEL